MSLVRFLPTPSDRMGILWTLLNIRDSIVLEYGPSGTTHYSMGLFNKLGVDQENRLFTTHMSEDDVVMGNTKRLEDAIEELDETFSPKVIFVVASSVSAVIGTDILGVCNIVQPKVKSRLIALEEGGFKGDYSTGLIEAYNMLVKQLVLDKKETNNTYNIIGASMGEYRTNSDIYEIDRLMKESFNINLNATLCFNTSITEIENMSNSSVNLVISYEGLKAAQYLKDIYNIPYVYMSPYGYTGTLNWLEEISKVINIDINANIVNELRNKIRETMQYKMYGRMLKKYPPNSYIYADYDKVVALSNFLSELSILPNNIICKHSLKNIKDPLSNIKYLPVEKDRMDILKSLNKTLIFADDISNYLANDSNTKIKFSTPIINGSQSATHLPFMGIRGADYIRECIDEYISSLM